MTAVIVIIVFILAFFSLIIGAAIQQANRWKKIGRMIDREYEKRNTH